VPAGITQLIDRQVSASLNFGSGDSLPGQSVSSGTGSQQYQGIVGMRQAQDPSTVRFTVAVGTLFGGIYQYCYHTYTTNQPARGQFVSWDLSVAESLYQVNGDAKPTTAVPTEMAGVVLCTLVTKNTWAWMQIAGRATCLFDSALTATLLGNMVSPKVSSVVASCFDCGAAAAPAVLPVGNAETLPAVSTLSVVQLNSQLLRRI
jgi:hypothetical protein